jgi:formyl-CoA transferase
LNNRPALTKEIEALLASVDGERFCEELLEMGVPAGPVRNMQQVMAHPHTVHRNMAASHEDYRGSGLPIKLSRTPGSIRRKPPRFGEHGRQILAEFGFDEVEIDGLVSGGILVEARRR